MAITSGISDGISVEGTGRERHKEGSPEDRLVWSFSAGEIFDTCATPALVVPSCVRCMLGVRTCEEIEFSKHMLSM